MKNKVLVLGVNGMLGSMIFKYLVSNKSIEVNGSSRKKGGNLIYFEVDEFLKNRKDFNGFKKFDYIINCIGKIKPHIDENDINSVKNAILTNSIFPIELSNFLIKSNTKIIQIATDCVFSGGEGNYPEDFVHNPTDVYGKTKSLGEVKAPNFLNIRCSIIGPEPAHKVSFLEWFLNQKEGAEILGFSHHLWNGVTTLQFAELCEKIIEANVFDKLVRESSVHHFIPNESLTKLKLLQIVKKVYKKDIKIKPVDNIGPKIDRTLSSKYKNLSKIYKNTDIESALIELRNYSE